MLELRRFLSVLPARAGMILGGPQLTETLERAPRTSGDDPDKYATSDGGEQCSPHERG